MGISNFVKLPEVQGEDHFPWIQPINLPSLRGAQSPAYLGLLLAPARLPSSPIPLLWEVRSGPPGKVPLKNILHYYPHPPHLGLSRGQISPEPKQCKQSNSGSRTKFRECPTSLLRRAVSFPEEPGSLASVPPLCLSTSSGSPACCLLGLWGSLFTGGPTTSGSPPSTGKTWRHRWRGRAER